jgi:hypothetical protein
MCIFFPQSSSNHYFFSTKKHLNFSSEKNVDSFWIKNGKRASVVSSLRTFFSSEKKSVASSCPQKKNDDFFGRNSWAHELQSSRDLDCYFIRSLSSISLFLLIQDAYFFCSEGMMRQATFLRDLITTQHFQTKNQETY